MKRLLVAASLLLVACGKQESAADFLKEVTTAARTKSRVQMSVKASSEEPTADDLALRKSIEDRIEQERLGRIISSGAGSGYVDVTVEVDNTAIGIAQLRKIAQEVGVLDKATFKVVTKE